MTGRAVSLTEVPDEAFSKKILGDGVAILPEEETVEAPEDGTVEVVFDTGHAVGFVTDTGISLLIHIGIDTVALGGKGFEILVENGQKVKKGTPLLKLDLPFLKEHAPSLLSPVVCTELSGDRKLRVLKQGRIRAGEKLLAVECRDGKNEQMNNK